jgi:hypothetical protein
MRDQSGFEAYVQVFWGRKAASAEGTFNDSALAEPEMRLLLEGPEMIFSAFAANGDLPYRHLAELLETPRDDRRTGQWVSPTEVHHRAATEQLLRNHPDVLAVRTFVEHGRLTACVLAHPGRTSPPELRAFALAELRPWIPAVCPGWFIICAKAPDDDDPDAWARMPRLAEGSGAAEPPTTPVDDKVQVLTKAVASVNDLDAVDPASSYAEIGGSVARIVKVLEAVHDQGYTGLTTDDLLRPSSLQRLAHSLTVEGT